jgi:glycosyltransferase involved in cell wall biosynthesis
MPKIVYIVTAPMTAKAFLRGHLSYVRDRGFDLTLISSPGADLDFVAAQEGVKTIGIEIDREINLWQDLVSLWQLYQALLKIQPDIVNASTPKAGFLGMLAAWFARVPIRIYLLRGLRAETATGGKKLILNTTEWLAAACASSVVAVSQSLSQTYLQSGLAPATKLGVLGGGSSNGVNPDRFLPTSDTAALTLSKRTELNLLPDTSVIGFVGRFTKDKGLIELLAAFQQVCEKLPQTHLLLVGGFEPGDPLPPATIAAINQNPQIIQTGFVNDTAPYYPLMQVFAFPSYREGFPNSPLEAALAGVPTVGFAATGVVDAIIDRQTGILIPLGDVEALAAALIELLSNPTTAQEMGRFARERAVTEFQPEQIWKNWLEFYQERLIAMKVSTLN